MNQARAFCIEYGLAMRTGAGGFHADIRRHLADCGFQNYRTAITLIPGQPFQ